MSVCAIVGINWGDEGKGRVVDLLAGSYDIVVRYQGGNNAGHTVVNSLGKFVLNLMPSGIFNPGVVNILGNGVVIDLEHICGEIAKLEERGIAITPDNFKISERALIVFPFHKALDCLEEARLKDAKYGSTRRGISPIYGDKYMKKAIMMGELRDMDKLRARLTGILEWKNLTIHNVYGEAEYSVDDMIAWIEQFRERLLPHICDTRVFLRDSYAAGKSVMYEAQLGALRDIDFGIYPYTSSSSPLAAYAPLGSGLTGARIDTVLGVMKAYSTCVGEGPFVCEMFEAEAEALRAAGGEYGAATGRPRRVGPFDVVASRYGVQVQGATEIALTKLDVLSYMEQIPVCVAYEVNGEKTTEMPFVSDLNDAKPVIEYMPGWHSDISGVRSFEELPREAQDYVLYLEERVGCRIKYVSVGAERDEIIIR